MVDLLIATQSAASGSVSAWLSAGAAAIAGVIVTIIVLLLRVGRNVATKSDVNEAQTKNERAIRDAREDLGRRIDRVDDKIDGLKTEVVRMVATTVGVILERRSNAQEEMDLGSEPSHGAEHRRDRKVN